MKLIITAALLVTTAIPASAIAVASVTGNGTCGKGQTTCGLETAPPATPTTSGPVNNFGGSVGPIGNSSSSTGGSVGPISNGSSSNSASIGVANASTGPITNSNAAQGGTANAYGGTSVATGGQGGNAITGPVSSNSAAQGGNAVTGPVTNTLTNDIANTNSNNSSASSNNANTNSSSVTVEGDRSAASTAFAPSLVVGSDTCMGSSSVGGQGMAFGFSVGTSWTDKNCIRLKNSRQLQALGLNEAAVQLMCLDKDVRKALLASGTPCSVLMKD